MNTIALVRLLAVVMASLTPNATATGISSPSTSNIINICNDQARTPHVQAAAAPVVTPDDASDEPIDQDVGEPIDQDVGEAMNQDADESTDQDADESTDQDADESMDQDADESTDQDADEPTDQEKKNHGRRGRGRRTRIGKPKQKRKNTTYKKVPADERKRAAPRPREDVNYDHDILGYYSATCHTQEEMRGAINTIFTFVLGSPEDDWEGRDGHAATIRSMLGGRVDARTIKRVMGESLKAQKRGDPYDPSRKTREPITAIDEGSKQQQMVADYRELGYSYDGVQVMINHYQLVNKLPRVCRSAIVSCEQRMQKEVTKIGRRPQGSRDKASPWARSRYNFAVQFLCRLGRSDEVDLEPFKRRNGGTLPDYLKEEKLRPFKLDMYKIVWWDEVHKDCFLGNFRQDAGEQVRFPRNPETGMYDPNSDVYLDEKTKLIVKYSQQMRLSLGVALVKDSAGEEKGVRCKPFDYTGLNIQTMKKYEDAKKKVINDVKTTDSETHRARWTTDLREKDKLYLDDPISMIKSVKGKVLNKFPEDLRTVKAILDSKDDTDRWNQIIRDTHGLGKATVEKVINNCVERHVNDNAPPAAIEHWRQPNPYASKYGTEADEWGEPAWETEMRKKIKSSERIVSITELVKHIVIESKKIFSDTDNYYFYHDALTQLVSKDTREWMKSTKIPGEDKCILDRWIKPELNISDNIKTGSGYSYAWAPPGNSPELMPLDNSLNRDVHTAVMSHFMYSLLLPEDDERKFSLKTPAKARDAYMRVFDPVDGVSPPSNRIEQDVKQSINALVKIAEAEGAYVEGLATQHRGHRYEVVEKKKAGGKRKREDFPIDIEGICNTEGVDPEGVDFDIFSFQPEQFHPDLRAALKAKSPEDALKIHLEALSKKSAPNSITNSDVDNLERP